MNMVFNLERAKKTIKKYIDANELEMGVLNDDKTRYTVFADFHFPSLSTNTPILFTIYDDGLFIIDIVALRLELNDTTMRLLNTFNRETYTFKAYVNAHGSLVFRHASFQKDNELFESEIAVAIGEFIKDATSDSAKSLVRMTKKIDE